MGVDRLELHGRTVSCVLREKRLLHSYRIQLHCAVWRQSLLYDSAWWWTRTSSETFWTAISDADRLQLWGVWICLTEKKVIDRSTSVRGSTKMWTDDLKWESMWLCVWVSVCVCTCAWEREREKEREKERERDRQTGRQADRQTQTEAGREGEHETERDSFFGKSLYVCLSLCPGITLTFRRTSTSISHTTSCHHREDFYMLCDSCFLS